MTDRFEAFAELLRAHFGWEPPLEPTTRLREDLELDSLELLEVLMVLEELSGHEVPEQVVEQVSTLQDLHELVRTYAAHR